MAFVGDANRVRLSRRRITDAHWAEIFFRGAMRALFSTS